MLFLVVHCVMALLIARQGTNYASHEIEAEILGNPLFNGYYTTYCRKVPLAGWLFLRSLNKSGTRILCHSDVRLAGFPRTFLN